MPFSAIGKVYVPKPFEFRGLCGAFAGRPKLHGGRIMLELLAVTTVVERVFPSPQPILMSSVVDHGVG